MNHPLTIQLYLLCLRLWSLFLWVGSAHPLTSEGCIASPGADCFQTQKMFSGCWAPWPQGFPCFFVCSMCALWRFFFGQSPNQVEVYFIGKIVEFWLVDFPGMPFAVFLCQEHSSTSSSRKLPSHGKKMSGLNAWTPSHRFWGEQSYESSGKSVDSAWCFLACLEKMNFMGEHDEPLEIPGFGEFFRRQFSDSTWLFKRIWIGCVSDGNSWDNSSKHQGISKGFSNFYGGCSIASLWLPEGTPFFKHWPSSTSASAGSAWNQANRKFDHASSTGTLRKRSQRPTKSWKSLTKSSLDFQEEVHHGPSTFSDDHQSKLCCGLVVCGTLGRPM